MSVRSPKAVEYNFEIPNNGDFKELWRLVDKTTGDPIMGTGDVVHMDLKLTRDISASSIISLNTLFDHYVTGIVIDPLTFDMDVTIRRADLEGALPSGKRLKLFYDLVVEFTDGLKLVYAYGYCEVQMGTTQA